MAKKRKANEPTCAPGFDAGLLLGQCCNYLQATRELVTTLRASGLAESLSDPLGSLRMQLTYIAPILVTRCEELAEMVERQGGKHGATKPSAAVVARAHGSDSS